MRTLGQRPRRIITRICVAVSSVLLLAEVIVAPLRHRSWHGGLGVITAAAVSIVTGLLYLRSKRAQRRAGPPAEPDDEELIWQPCPQGGLLGWLFVMAEEYPPVYWLTVPLWWARWRIWRWRVAAPFETSDPFEVSDPGSDQ